MKKLLYTLVKISTRGALYLYYGKIEVSGLGNVPLDKPVLFLPNHQSALIDVLLLAVGCNRKPYFLTRADIFKNKHLNTVFTFFRMLPIYRIRDGREAMKKNQEVFDSCANLLANGEAILMFPEANHNIKRRIRPLSKGFTRILFNALEKNPGLDVHLIPVGLNYRNSAGFPDKVAVNFGESIPVQDVFEADNIPLATLLIKDTVALRLKELTTHIEDESSYDVLTRVLEAQQVDYLKPREVNAVLARLKIDNPTPSLPKRRKGFLLNLGSTLFMILNLPVILLWRGFIKPKVWEPEFMGTMRFGFALIMYPLYFLLLFMLVTTIFNTSMAILVIGFLFLYNWLYVRLC